MAGETVTIASKFPNGFYMAVHKYEEYDEPVIGGGMRTMKHGVQNGERVLIKGPNAQQGMSPLAPVEGGYALTHNVPADFAKQWFEENKMSDMVRNHVVFMAANAENATRRAREQKEIRSGFERLDPGTIVKEGRDVPRDPRWPKSSHPNLSNIATDARE